MDDDDENDNHQAIDLQNDDVVGDGHNDNVDNDNETSRKCLPNSLYPPQFEISQFFPETKPSSSLVWTTCKEVALQQICLFAGFWFLSLHLTLSWSLNSPRSSCTSIKLTLVVTTLQR